MPDKSPAAAPGRRIVNIHSSSYRVYDMEGPVQRDMSYLPLTYDAQGHRMGFYAIRMEPGAVTIPHTHQYNEDYLILEGDLVEPDGRVLGPGDFVHYDPGTRHNSRSETGCLLIGCDWGNPADVEKSQTS
ncbi:MAG: cupin domain-containing protein [Kiloniellales bacterium]